MGSSHCRKKDKKNGKAQKKKKIPSKLSQDIQVPGDVKKNESNIEQIFPIEEVKNELKKQVSREEENNDRNDERIFSDELKSDLKIPNLILNCKCDLENIEKTQNKKKIEKHISSCIYQSKKISKVFQNDDLKREFENSR